MAEQQKDGPRDDLSRVSGEGSRGTTANIGRDGDALGQDDVLYGTGTDRAGTPEDRERDTEERNVP